MANLKKKCKVVILPSEKYSPLVLSTSKYGGLFKSEHYSPMKEMGDAYQNLFITSDEQIKEGDWFIYINEVYQKTKTQDIQAGKKIIVTTDSSLIINSLAEPKLGMYLPQPSPQFIQAYIEAYNDGNPIVYVMVEYEDFWIKVAHWFNESITSQINFKGKLTQEIVDKIKEVING